jgi:hypothetical protein
MSVRRITAENSRIKSRYEHWWKQREDNKKSQSLAQLKDDDDNQSFDLEEFENSPKDMASCQATEAKLKNWIAFMSEDRYGKMIAYHFNRLKRGHDDYYTF